MLWVFLQTIWIKRVKSKMIKKILSPKVVVYRNVFSNPQETLASILDSKERETNFVFKKWEHWGQYGFSSTASLYGNDFERIMDSPIGRSESNIFLSIEDAYWKVVEDYIKEWKSVGDWPYVTDWSFTRGQDFIDLKPTDPILLMYNPNPQDRLAMSYHTDQHQFDFESPKDHLFITVTIYLNDDYGGGELSFIKEDTKEISYFKPKAGDITVFPSGLPYFHGVESISSGQKYLLRMFVTCKYDGSESWNRNKKNYGAELWEKMEKERIESDWNLSKWFRLPVFLDDTEENLENQNVHGERIYFPYNREEAKKNFLVRWDSDN